MMLVSESAKEKGGKDLFYNNIKPVQLNPLQHKEYTKIFFPKDAKDRPQTRGGKVIPSPKPGDLYNIIHELNFIATQVNAAYAIGRCLLKLNSGRRDDSRSDEEQKSNFVQWTCKPQAKTILNSYMSKADEKFMLTTIPVMRDSQSTSVKKNAGRYVSYVIKPSKKFSGGYDVLWIGKPGCAFGNSPMLGAHTEYSMYKNLDHRYTSLIKSKTDYYPIDVGIYNENEDALQIVAMLEMLNTLLTGDKASSMEEAHKRNFTMLPLDFDFKALSKLVIPNLNYMPFEDMFTKNLIDSVKMVKQFKEYFSILVIVDPSTAVTKAKLNSLYHSVPHDASEITSEILKCTPNISFSVVMHLPKDYAHYITQTAPSDEPSLVSLNQWVNQWSKYAIGVKASKLVPPDFIVNPKLLASYSTKRKQYGNYVENGNNDSNNITVSNDGTLIYCPKLENLSFLDKNTTQYEKISNETLQKLYSLNLCPNFDTTYVDESIDAENDSTNLTKSLGNDIQKIQALNGTMLACTWDYNRIVYADSDPSIMKVLKLEGVQPNELAIADYIGTKYNKGITLMSGPYTQNDRWENNAGKRIKETMELYSKLYKRGVVKSFQELCNEAKTHFGVESLIDEKFEEYEVGLYTKVLKTDLVERTEINYEEGEKVKLALADCMVHATGKSYGNDTTNLLKVVTKNMGSVKNNSRYFDSDTVSDCKVSDFKNVYNWFGGYVYYLALCQIRDAGSKVFEISNDDGIPDDYPTTKELSTKIMPYVVTMSKYVPDCDSIYKKAERLRERNKPMDKSSEEINNEILVQGTQEGAQQFPHGVVVQKTLRNRPKFCLLDIQAGGGKTIICLTDIACTIRESKAEKVAIKPLVIVPTQLVKNWCEDFIRIVGPTWNYIPLTTETNDRWEFERLNDMIKNAPPNTIVIAGMDYIAKSNSYNVVVGGNVEKSSMSVEFIKNFGFNYVAIDEAHFLKSTVSDRHKLCKQICTMSVVKYVRLLSGTMIPNDLKDIVGISSLCSGHIFRTETEFEANRSSIEDSFVTTTNPNIAAVKKIGQVVRDRLGDTVALVTVKRKEWAFMLPSPIERFIPLYISYEEEERFAEDPTPPKGGKGQLQDLLASTHRAVYEAVLGKALEELKEELIKRKKDSLGAAISNRPTTSIDPDTGETIYDDGFDISDEALEELMTGDAGDYFFQRIDKVLMDPENDPVGAEMFESYREKYPDLKFVSRKVQKIIEILEEHFAPIEEWSRGKYKAHALVQYKGQIYSSVHDKEVDEFFESSLPPDRDENHWVADSIGKVLIITRYNLSVEAIYNNLPQKFKQFATTLYGTNSSYENKANFKNFERDENIKIMIANEQRVSVGFNLQYASRIIRAEAPWTPGEMEQTNSRVFRPDPAGFSKGKLSRNIVHLDWLICNNTLEVIKMCKLYRKAILNCQYDEANNTDGPNGTNLYQSILQYSPTPISLNKTTLRRDVLLTNVFQEYIAPYSQYFRIRNKDFEAMRKKDDAKMINMIVTGVPSDFKKIDYVPYVYGQKIADPYNFEYEALSDFLSEKCNEKYLKALLNYGISSGLAQHQAGKTKIVNTKVGVDDIPIFKTIVSRGDDGKPLHDSNGKVVKKSLFVHYEGGYGTIVSLGLAFRNSTDSPLESLVIKTVDGKKVTVDLKKTEVFIINNIDDLNKNILAKSKSVFGDDTKKPTNLDDKIDDIIVTDDEDDMEDVLPVRNLPSVTLVPAVYNKFVALEIFPVDNSNTDEIQKMLDETGINLVWQSNYAHISVHNKKSFGAIFAALKQNGFELEKNSIPALKTLQKSFHSDTQQFVAELAPVSELKTFFAMSHRTMNDKSTLKVYPLISNGKLELVVDLKTNKMFKSMLNVTIEGITTSDKSFKRASGMFLGLFETKAQLGAVIAKIKGTKLKITNYDDLKSLYKNLKTHVGGELK